MGRRHGRRRGRKPTVEGSVELNMAAMLDMAFQLLAFFILTFNPSDVEIQISMLMPPSRPVAGSGSSTAPNVDLIDVDTSLPLPIRVFSNPDRSIREIQIGGEQIAAASMQEFLTTLDARVAQMFQTAGFEAVELNVQSELGYESLIRIVDVCMRQKLQDGTNLTKLSIFEFQ